MVITYLLERINRELKCIEVPFSLQKEIKSQEKYFACLVFLFFYFLRNDESKCTK